MRAIYFEEFNGLISIKEIPVPQVKPTGAVIKVMSTGMCRSDWHGYVGHDSDIKLPHVPGHEFAGEIHELGNEVTNFHIGQRVTVPFINGCATCEFCKVGESQVCPTQTQPGFTQFGSFAEYVHIENADFNLIPLPNEIDFDAAAALGCRFATSYRGLVIKAKLKPGHVIAIFGCGGVGLSALVIAKKIGATVICIDLQENVLTKAKALGADLVINPNIENVLEKISEFTNLKGVDVSVDALGSMPTSNQSILALKRLGKHVQLGLLPSPDGTTPIPMARAIAYELEILGSHGLSSSQYQDLLEFVAAHKIDLSDLVSEVVPLESGVNLLAHWESRIHSGVTILKP